MDKKGKEKTYVLVRFRSELLQNARNSLIRDRSILNNCHGRVCGIGEEIEVVEGHWTPGRCIAILEFADCHGSWMWYEGTPSVKQPDWLGGVEMISVPANKFASLCESSCIQLSDSSPVCRKTFEEQYICTSQTGLDSNGAVSNIIKSDKPNQVRGNWAANHLQLNQWASKEHFHKWYNSDDYAKLKELRQGISSCNLVIFRLEPLRLD